MEYVEERRLRELIEFGYELSIFVKGKIREDGFCEVGKGDTRVRYTDVRKVSRLVLRADTKRAIRNTMRDVKHDNGYDDAFYIDDKTINVRWSYVSAVLREDDWDRACYKTFLPEVHLNEEEKKYLIDDMWEHWYNPYDDGRDCTGVWFTSHISVFDVPNGTWIYHFKNMDV